MANPHPSTPGRPFQKGQVTNPLGLNRKTKPHPDYLKFREFTDESVETLVSFMRGDVSALGIEGQFEAVPLPLRYAATVTILERGWGKPFQAVGVDINDNRISPSEETDALEFIQSRLASIAARLDQKPDTQLADARAEEEA